MTTLDKIRRFERYLELTRGQADQMLDVVLDKLLERKRSELARHLTEMRVELDSFETRYGMASARFFEQFERGELGDAADYFDWSATWQMFHNAQQYLHALSDEPAAT